MDHEHDNFAKITPREMRARKRGKLLLSVDQSERQDGPTTAPLDQSEQSVGRNRTTNMNLETSGLKSPDASLVCFTPLLFKLQPSSIISGLTFNSRARSLLLSSRESPPHSVPLRHIFLGGLTRPCWWWSHAAVGHIRSSHHIHPF